MELSEDVIGKKAICFRVLISFTTREMPKDVHHQQERVKLCKLGGKSKNKVEASPSQSNKLGGVGKMFAMSKSRKQMWERMKTAQVDQMKDYRIEGKTHRRSPAEGPKKMKEVSAKVVAVKKIEPKEGSVPGVGGGVDPGEPGRKILVEKWQNIERHFSEREIDSQANASLASGGKEGKIFVMSKSRKQMWDRMKKNVASAPRLVQSAHVDQMRDYRPKGKTHRAGVNKILAQMKLQKPLHLLPLLSSSEVLEINVSSNFHNYVLFCKNEYFFSKHEIM